MSVWMPPVLLAAATTALVPGAMAQSAPSDAAQATPVDSAAAARCAALTGRAVSARSISLPSKGAAVTGARLMPIDGTPRHYCQLLGQVAPVDPEASPILFRVNLPIEWNGKLVQYGGGGLNGTLIDAMQPLRDSPPGQPTPLAQGYVTVGTDSGHRLEKPAPQIYALNDEMFENHAYASYKKVSDVSRTLLRSFYGKKQRYAYFFGGSEGGRQAMMFVQRFPREFNGVVAAVPVMNMTGIQFSTYNHWQLLRADGWMSPAQVKLWSDAVLGECDARDGIADGVLASPARCDADAAIARLRCAGDRADDGCLTDPQLALIAAIRSPLQYALPLANGETSYPAFPSGGETQPRGVDVIVDTVKPPADEPAHQRYPVGNVRYWIARDPAFSAPLDEVKYKDRIAQISRMLDTTDPDLSAFRRAGGKLIMRMNGADYVHSPDAIARYYELVKSKMGAGIVDTFVSVYYAPGLNHFGQGLRSDGVAIPERAELLSVLDGWVTAAKVPGDLILTSYDKAGPAVVSSWPLCRYPAYPHYTGNGDPLKAASYQCRPADRPAN